jgi:hypothetical protein
MIDTRSSALVLIRTAPADPVPETMGQAHGGQQHGDPLYCDKALQRTYPRLMLHALNIQFDRPSREPVRVGAPIPPALTQFMENFFLQTRLPP